MYPLKPEILICIELHLPFYLYDLAFSKHLRTYSLYMPVLCLSNPFMHSSLCIQNIDLIDIKSPNNQYTPKKKKKIYFHLFSIFKNTLQTRLCFKNPKLNVVGNCLAVYDVPYRTQWNTNYIAHVQKRKEVERLRQVKCAPKGLP